MADIQNSIPGPSQEMPSQPATAIPGYESPVFDLRNPAPAAGAFHAAPNAPQVIAASERPVTAPNAAAAPVNNAVQVQISEQKIEIAPHPTTNRFPWAPVENPTVPIYEPMTPNREPDLILEDLEKAPPPEPAPVPEPVHEPEPEPAAEPAPPAPDPVPVPPKPELEPITEPVPEPVPEPPLPLEPVEPPAAVESLLPPVVPITSEDKKPGRQSRNVLIYGHSTRAVWAVLRPEKLIKILLGMVFLAVIAIGIYLWVATDASLDFSDLPFMKELLKRT